MPPPQRVRYNAAARKSTAGGSSHKKRKGGGPKANDASAAAAPSSFAHEELADDGSGPLDIVEKKSHEDKERDRKERMKAELLEGKEGKMSSKKRKRLEGYIDKKLKKESRQEMFQRLQDMQAELPPSLLPSLASASTLGSRQLQSHADKAAKLEDKTVRRALKRRRGAADSESGSGGEDEEDWEVGKGGPVRPRPTLAEADEPTDAPAPKQSWSGATVIDAKAPVAVGGALARDADGNPMAPVVVKKRIKGPTGTFASWGLKAGGAGAVEDEDEDEDDFDSSDSGMDSDGSDGSDGMELDIPTISGGFGVNPEDDSEDGSDDDDDDSEIDMGSDGMSDDEGGSEEEDEASAEEEAPKPRSQRAGGFKQWALNQMSATYNQSAAPGAGESGEASTSSLPAVEAGPNLKLEALRAEQLRKQQAEIAQGKVGPLGEQLVLPSTSLLKPSTNPRNHVKINRDPKIQEARMKLPVVAEEQQIMEAITLNPAIVLCGETGSGKTTQVPQFLFEAGYGTPGSDNPGMIAVTQPRRVAAMSTSLRVAQELNLPTSKVSYQIRYDATTSAQTSIKFMTDGVLLRELARDMTLSKYSVVCVDEAHERGVNTDVLIGILARVVKLRKALVDDKKPGATLLRLVIMSATLRTTDFTHNARLFKTPPPTVTIPTRQHPVTVHFNRKTQADYPTEAFNKVSKIHTRLPPGGVLVFLTGQGEIVSLVKKLEKRFGRKAWEERQRQRGKAIGGFPSRAGKGKERETEADDQKGDMKIVAKDADVEIEDLDYGEEQAHLAADVDDGADSDPEALDSDSDDENEIINAEADAEGPMHILPLYSLLPSDKQLKVFEAPPEGSRLVIIATNVAETSLTIPGIRYVVDCGRAKERHFDPVSGVQSFRVSWISKASASQRAGRAGRTGPGHCYRLYSSSVFENYFEQFAEPEILRMPIEGMMLQMKSMAIDNVINFPFPTPPDRTSLAKAEKMLNLLGAIEDGKASKNAQGQTEIAGGRITEIGRAMSSFPVAPRFARMLVTGHQQGLLPYVIAIVAVLAVGDPFLREEALGSVEDDDDDDHLGARRSEISHIRNAELRRKEELRMKRKAFFELKQVVNGMGGGKCDAFPMLAIVCAYEYEGGGERFCAKHFVRPKAMDEIHKLRLQISNIASTMLAPAAPAPAPKSKTYKAPAPAKVADAPLFDPKMPPPTDAQFEALRMIMASAFIDQIAIRKDLLDPSDKQYTSAFDVPYRAMGVDDDVYIDKDSVMFPVAPPEWVVWGDIVRTSKGKSYMKSVTRVNPEWLARIAPAKFLSHSKPIDTSKAKKGLKQKLVGSKAGEERPALVLPRFHFAAADGGMGVGAKGIELPLLQCKEVWSGGRWVLQTR